MIKENHSFKETKHCNYKTYLLIDVTSALEKRVSYRIEILSGGVKHPNIVTLLGFVVEDSEMILVIDNFSNGFLVSIWKTSKTNVVLTWEKRLKICIDVAHGLHYIHSQMEDQKMIIIS
ncbi:putative protein kinase RLK-Pelle-LRR-III family [Helianthus annuus]|uniref:Protein kinase domain-containing protein n=1 Tax=Helianthus annuus TaxID=4232 RepID=A0A9K3JZL3_HELAN|nr:putative protein kinase RLK-Pelle-LRR-III family [Helianthus annuus]